MHTFTANGATFTIFSCVDFGYRDSTQPVDPEEIAETVLTTGYACLTPDIFAELIRNHHGELKERGNRSLLVVTFASDFSSGNILDSHDGWRIEDFDEVAKVSAIMRDPRYSWLFMVKR